MASKKTIKPSLSETAWSAALLEGVGNTDDTQVTEFTFASISEQISAAKNTRLELLLEAEPRMSKAHGLIFKMTLNAYCCEEDDSEQLFTLALSEAHCLGAARAKNPIGYCMSAIPAIIKDLDRRWPEASEALKARAEAMDLRESLGKAVVSAPSRARRLRI